jgi:hypothetical protein
MTSIVAAIGPSTQTRLTPYLTVDMLKYGSYLGTPVGNLVPGPNTTPAEQDAALAEIIEQASSWVDEVACQQVLAATIDTVLSRAVVSNDGFVYINPQFRPVLAVLGVSVGMTAGSLQALDDLTGIGVQDDVITIPGSAPLPAFLPDGRWLQFGAGLASGARLWYQSRVLSGWPVTLLNADAEVGATSISVEDTTGIIEGNTQLTIYAGTARRRFIAGAVSTAVPGSIGTGPGTVVCPALTQALENNPQNPIMVSAMPATVNKAVALVVRSFVKDKARGNTNAATAAAKDPDALGSGSDLSLAYSMLQRFALRTTGTTSS